MRPFPLLPFVCLLVALAGCSGGEGPAQGPAAGGNPEKGAAAPAAGDQRAAVPEAMAVEPVAPREDQGADAAAVGQLVLGGTVIGPDGASVAGARVYVLPAKAAAPHGHLHATVSGADGSFRLVLPGGFAGRRVDLVAAADGLQREGVQGLELRSDLGAQRITLRRGRGLQGRVETPAGKPVGGAVVVATSGDLPEPGPMTGLLADLPPLGIGGPWRERAVTDADGRFELTGLRLEAYRLHLVSNRWFGSSGGVVLPGSGDAKISAYSGDRIEVSVSAADGGGVAFPLSGELWVWRADRIGSVSTTVDATWSTEPVALLLPSGEPGTYPRRFQLNLRDADGRVGRVQGVLSAPGREVGQPLVLQSDGRVAVRLTPADPANAPEVLRVHYRAGDQGAESNTVVERVGGHYPLRLPPGRLGLRVQPLVATPFPVEFQGELDLQGGGEVAAGFSLPAGGTIELDASALADRSDLVRVTGPGAVGWEARVRWDDAGRAVWPHARPGAWQVELQRQGAEPALREFAVRPGATTTVRW